ncbi:MAG: HigA family addiction module antidote protein [Salinivirgaceae bacterium]|nr:HigA family addiction module antidote protein [Salinivirgaceae bacterium]
MNNVSKNGEMEQDGLITVGSVVMQILEERAMKQSELAEMTGIQKPIINDLIKGKRNMTAETAVLFEAALGVSADYLMNIQTNIDLERARKNPKIADKVGGATAWSLVKDCVSVSILKSKGLINDGDMKGNVQRVFDVFGVKSEDEIQSRYEKEHDALYRKSTKLTTDTKALFTWKYLCISQSEKLEMDKPFSRDAIDGLAQELKTIFRENRNTIERTQEAVEACGIKLIHEEKAGQVPVDGMSFWKGANPTIVYTKRLKTIDNFAFTIMHELGHVKLHLEDDGEAMINVDGGDIDDKEKEANNFANNVFIAPREWAALMARLWNPYTAHVLIKKEADQIGVNPQILFGRYMHETGLYRLRRVFETDIK